MKTLRLTFAMGGGVSLGSFSGAALTEILRALVLHGQDREGRAYDRVVLDSMSGASAGAIALAILMRSLMDYQAVAAIISTYYWLEEKADSQDFFELKKKKKGQDQTVEEFLGIIGEKSDQLIRDQITESLAEEEKFTLLEQLKAIEVAQILQEILWVRETNIHKLLKSDPKTSSLENFSLLPRDSIIEQIRKYLLPKENELQLENQKILSDRVLFACSLTNLVPNKIVENVEGVNLDDFPQVREVKRALNSKSHKELRIFDFKLRPPEKLGPLNTTESNWLEISPGKKGSKEAPLQSDIHSEEAWARIAASVIACGAFPIAFSPVILRRWKKEFPRYADHTSPNSTQQYHSVWEVPGVEDHKLPYVDGGTFNNEPIREAFRLANYIDTNLRKNKDGNKTEENFDRLVVFVDPIVDSKDLTYHMSSYSQLNAQTKGGSLSKIRRKKAISRMASLTGRLIGMLRNQGSVKEEHKISNYLDQVQLKARLSAHLNQLEIPIDDSAEELELFKEIIHHVEKALLRGEIPLGTRDIGKYLFWTAQDELEQDMSSIYPKDKSRLKKEKKRNAFLERIGEERTNQLAELFGIERWKTKKKEASHQLSFEQFSSLVEALKKADPQAQTFSDVFDQVFDEKTPFYLHLREFIKRVFLNITIDAALDIDGKDPRAVQVAITPVAYAPPGSNEAKTIALPGSEIQAFGGFTSLTSRAYSFNYGRYCALQTLKRKDIRAYYSDLKLDSTMDPDKSSAPFISEKAFSGLLLHLRELLNGTSANSLNSQLEEDFKSLQQGRLIRPFFYRLLDIFPEIRRAAIYWGSVAVILFLLVGISVFLVTKAETAWALLVSISAGISVLTLIVLGLLLRYFIKQKKDFKNYFFREVDSFPNYEVTLLWHPLAFGKKIKAVRFNEQGRYIKTAAVDYKGESYTAVKLFIRQTERDGYHRTYDLFFHDRSKRNWKRSPLNSYERSLNLTENDTKKVNSIHFTTHSRLGRLFSFNKHREPCIALNENGLSTQKEGRLEFDSQSLDKAMIERLKFYIDPAVILGKENGQYGFIKYICLTEELEKLILKEKFSHNLNNSV